MLIYSPLTYAAETIGQGSTQCAKFLKLTELNDQVEDSFMNWAEGYVSGLATDQAQNGTEADASVFLFHYSYDKEKIRQFCEKFPKSTYQKAVHKTFLELLEDQGTDIGKDTTYKAN